MEMSDGSVCLLSGVAACAKMGLFAENCISADQLRQKQLKAERVIVLDVRSQTSYRHSHIQGAALARVEDYYRQEMLFKRGATLTHPNADEALAENVKKYPKNALIVTYCDAGCQTSSAMVIQIKRFGFENVKVLEDGFQAWQEKGYPVSVRKQ